MNQQKNMNKNQPINRYQTLRFINNNEEEEEQSTEESSDDDEVSERNRRRTISSADRGLYCSNLRKATNLVKWGWNVFSSIYHFGNRLLE